MQLGPRHNSFIKRLAEKPETIQVGESHLHPAVTSFPLPDIARLLGSSNGTALGKKTLRKVEIWKEHLRLLVRPRLVYAVWPVVKNGRSRVEIINGIQFRSKKLVDALGQSPLVVCFAATLGNNIEAEVNKLNLRKEFSNAYVVDAIGSVGAEQIVEQFHRQLESNLRAAGRGVTLPFSPGYCDWPLQEQSKLFSSVDARRIGVGLSDSSLMIPRKSISGVFGITDSPSSLTQRYNPCLECGKTDCEARRTPRNPQNDIERREQARGCITCKP